MSRSERGCNLSCGPVCFLASLSMRRNSTNHPTLDPRHHSWRLRIGPSRIQGLGVFASEPISPGRKVIEYTGERISQREANERFRRMMRSRKPKRFCLFHLKRGWVIDGAVGGSGAELINHSCDPNLRTRRIRGHILYFSQRRIRKGEELTVDYKFSKRTVRVPCSCGSATCRGTINLK